MSKMVNKVVATKHCWKEKDLLAICFHGWFLLSKFSKKISIKPQREGNQIANKFIYFAYESNVVHISM